MNPSYSNGGIIASGPDPADVPSTLVSAPTPQPMGLGASSRKPKRGLIIGALSAIVILIVILVVVLLMGGGKGGGGNGSINANFNKLINYVANGNESTADISGEYSATGNYYFLNGWDTEEEKTTIYNKTKNLIDNFYASYKDGDNQTLNNLVKSTKDQFDFMYVVDLKENSAILNPSIEDGKDKLKQNLIDYYNLSKLDNNNIYKSNFVEAYEEWIDAKIDEGKLFSENGCLVDGFLNIKCMVDKNNEDIVNEMSDASSAISMSYKYLLSYYDMGDSFIFSLYNINTLLNGGTIVEADDE